MPHAWSVASFNALSTKYGEGGPKYTFKPTDEQWFYTEFVKNPGSEVCLGSGVCMLCETFASVLSTFTERFHVVLAPWVTAFEPPRLLGEKTPFVRLVGPLSRAGELAVLALATELDCVPYTTVHGDMVDVSFRKKPKETK